MVVPGMQPVHVEFDSQGRPVYQRQGSESSPLNRFQSWTFNNGTTGYASGTLVSTTNALNQTTLLDNNHPMGWTSSVTNAAQEKVKFDYMQDGSLESLAPPGRSPHFFTNDVANGTQPYVPPAPFTGETTIHRRKNGQVDNITLADGNTVSFNYFANIGILHQVILPGQQGNITYGYNNLSQVTGVYGPSGPQVQLDYQGPLLHSMTLANVLPGAATASVQFAYDNFFRLSQETAGALAVGYSYDVDGQLMTAGALNLTRDATTGWVTQSQVGTITDSYNLLPAGESLSFGELRSVETKAGTTSLMGMTFERDKLGRITQKVEVIQGVTHTYQYSYDAAGRLVQVLQDGQSAEQYSYGTNGSRTSGPNVSQTTYDGQDRLVQYGTFSYTYNAMGQLQQKTDSQDSKITQYSYDAIGNLRSVTLPDSQVISYQVDGMGRRVARSVNGSLQKVWLYRDALNPVAEYDGQGNLVSRFVYGTKGHVPDYLVRNSVTYRVVTDQLGSVRLVVNAATGSVVQRIDYDSFGNIVSDSNPGFQPFGFAGGLYDNATKLTRFGARDYDALTGRWTAKDPIGFAGGDSNLYRYSFDNPVNLIDVSGLDIWLEGGSPGREPYFHQSVSIGDPLGYYDSYSFGIAKDLSGKNRFGTVYLDDVGGGEVLEFLKTSKKQDAIARNMIFKSWDKDSDNMYSPNSNCIAYSNDKFDKIQRALNVAPSNPPTNSAGNVPPISGLGDYGYIGAWPIFHGIASFFKLHSLPNGTSGSSAMKFYGMR
jgi:RHS repeat-associated protein